MEPNQFLAHLKDVASSPLAFVAYVCLVGAWTYVLVTRQRLSVVAKALKDLPEERRADVLIREYNTTPREGLSAEEWIRARKQVLLLVSFLASLVAAIGIAGIALMHAKNQQPLHREAQLALVDTLTSVTENGPLVEFKVRNNSDEAVFIKRAEFITLDEWDLPRPGMHPDAMPVTQTYDVTISDDIGQTTVHNLSQALTPNTLDRFAFRIATAHKRYPFVGLFVFLIRIRLIYNEDDRVLESPSIFVNLPPPMEVLALYQGSPPLSELEENRRAAQEILHRMNKNTVCSEELLKAIKSWATVDLSRFGKN